MRIRWLGHSGFEITGSRTVVIDPFLTGNPKAPHGPEGVKACHVLLVSHEHADHQGDALAILLRTGGTLVGVHEMAVAYEAKGCKSEGMNIGGTLEVNEVRVNVVNALHSSPGSREVGYIVELDGKTLYHMGDTGLFGDLELYARFFKIDLAMVPIGDRYTMGPRSAAEAVRMIKAKKVIPMHYGTFPSIEQDPQQFRSLVGGSAEVIVLAPGESYELA